MGMPMQINLTPKRTKSLYPTDILFQTSYWGRVKSSLGFEAMAFDIESSGPRGDVLALVQPLGTDGKAVYIQQGPEYAPEKEEYGTFLEELSQAMLKHLGREISFIRYDLPWESQYAEEIKNNFLESYPEARLREMRMNMGTRSWNLRKASMDMTVASTMMVDIRGSDREILDRMKPKARYNIGLAKRKGVKVFRAEPDRLPEFYDLYRQTACRNGFAICNYKHFQALFNTHLNDPGNSELLFLLAAHNQEVLSGAIVAVSGKTALYLYGASSSEKRNYMAPYAMHFDAIKRAKSLGCTGYDMGAVCTSPDPEHPFYGLYRFKTGFGGKVQFRSGSWDYPLDENKYLAFTNSHNLSRSVIS
ncbi:lipid II:glycine glycyltransferase FemX [Desulfonatronovibrio hydrogenovorans]|uniref:lipid II:glycine glycyltransferase FemX n=1 Tax=Desulfonatronovibrio hydrogenovorans TaxID=53245 RepID=UPI000A6E22BE|nr:peptidoglycan bridge formation glycyltransferase FemA/FemB family protein [Desulfonatronovibrio hydrogenovorans]